MAESTNPSVRRGFAGRAAVLGIATFAVLSSVAAGSLATAAATPTPTATAVSGHAVTPASSGVVCRMGCRL